MKSYIIYQMPFHFILFSDIMLLTPLSYKYINLEVRIFEVRS